MPEGLNQNELLNHIRQICNSWSYHGLSKSDKAEFLKLLMSVMPNDRSSKTGFPDFVSEHGFIKLVPVVVNESKNDESKPIFITGYEDDKKDESVERFHKKFVDAWRSHIKRLRKYKKKHRQLSCFLISSNDCMLVREYRDDKNDILFGGLRRRDNIDFCLSYDKQLLDYMYQYKTDVDYVIYYNTYRNCVEVLKVSNIPMIKKYLHNYCRYRLYFLPAYMKSRYRYNL